MNQVFGSPPPPRSSSPWAWCLWIVIIGGLLLVLAMVALVAFGWGLFSDEAKSALQDDPAIREHIGTIESMELSFDATSDAPGTNEFVWDVEGDKGKGRVLAHLVTDEDGERLESGTLTLPDGREVPLGDAREGEPSIDPPPTLEPAPAGAPPGGASGGNYKDGSSGKPIATKEPPDVETEEP